MYDTILVPLDGSGRAEAILPYVIELARSQGAKLVLLRVVDPAVTYSGVEGLPFDVARDIVNAEAEEAKRYLEAKQSELQAENIEVTTSVRYGAISQAIIEAAEADGADLIALASHGRTGLARMFYGSVAAGILNRADRPLLLIRSTEE